MPRRVGLLLLACALVGCSQARRRAPLAEMAWAPADWELKGKVRHEECGTYIFAIDFARAFTNQQVRLPGVGPFPRMPPEESRALYHALEKMPEATHLLPHRSRTTANGLVIGTLPIFGERCVSVEAHGVQIGKRPVAIVIHGEHGAGAGPGEAPVVQPVQVVPPAPPR